jgi:hypothetical protein
VSKVKSLIFDARYLLGTVYPLLQEEGGAAAVQGVPPVSGGPEAGLPPPQGEAGGSGSWRPGIGSLNPKPSVGKSSESKEVKIQFTTGCVQLSLFVIELPIFIICLR